MDILSELKFKVIVHKIFGIGIIDSVSMPYVRIQFDNQYKDFK
jgi:hypothetical protein